MCVCVRVRVRAWTDGVDGWVFGGGGKPTGGKPTVTYSNSSLRPLLSFLDLGLDSLDAVEVVMAIEDEFAIEIPDAEADKIASVSDAIEYISAHPMAK